MQLDVWSDSQEMNNRSRFNFASFIKYGLTIVILCIAARSGLAQSDNYWSWNFNTPSTLLAGSVVGGSAGPSAVYYNPALIDHEKVPSISLSASLVSFQFFRAKDIAGDGIDANKYIFKIQPRFLSYTLPNKNERLGLEAAILSPVSEEMEYTIQHIDTIDIIRRTEGMETYSGYMKYHRKFDDTWVGFGFSYKVGDNFYVGGSSFLSIKNFKYQFRHLKQAYQEDDSVIVNQVAEPRYIAQSTFEEELKYWDTSLIFKIGGQYKSSNDRFSTGANITFPNIPIIGQADVRKAFNRSNVYDNSTNTFTPNEIFIEIDESVAPTVKNPFSAAFGFQYFTKNKRNSISFTMEYFHNIDPYAVVESTGTSGKLPDGLEGIIDENDLLSYYFEARSLTNVAIGFKQYISSTFLLLGGFRTDFTAGTSNNIRFIGDNFKINQIHMDKYHITLGPTLTAKKFSMVTGIQYTFGRQNDMEQMVNFADPVEYIPFTGQALEGVRKNNASASVDEFALFFGMTLDLTKNQEK